MSKIGEKQQKGHSHKNIKTVNKKTKVMVMMKHQTWCVRCLSYYHFYYSIAAAAKCASVLYNSCK